ncbi:MAG: hypothetical protein K0S35_169 [Geminicoccaceae bacterium]|jgi:hypothetical protein|nr:hypothetical protein [Geminicoccaceae bacterium]
MDRPPRPLSRVQLAEVAVVRMLFVTILRRIDRLRGPPVVTA